MSDLKTAEQFYQASLENLNKAKELHEATDATSRKTVALFSCFIDETKFISGDVELAARNNLKEIQSRDVLAVINSIVAMMLDMPKPFLAHCCAGSAIKSFDIYVWNPNDKDSEDARLEGHLILDKPSVLKDALSLESQLAEFIIEVKDNAEVTA
ncbi:hypothetical protein [Aliivibrio fischeri]|uniref:hypothetical protein n=1 Tax=Aliivibrio fischeri TaxID=668 RepID=UPI00107EC422|nr:hypothetical protein [Aliivibrio fischeri]MCE7556362.1 hypothetical protein [Aliivibrio fischeri]MCE7563075.1 hypothetical protein [Aliivibrio fischeri]MCE7571367.1 hypothetical protein [Aliivibrio fischeri]TGA68289.1 hypothetical protein VFES401_15535 [Aliivibrio fischeri]